MPAQSDNDRKVLQAILSALDEVSEEARERILRTVSTFYGLSPLNGLRPLQSEPRPAAHIPTNDRELSFADRATLSPKDFVHDKQPKTDAERVACLAYYLTHFRDTPHFKTIDISKLNTAAAQLKFANSAQSMKNAIRSGLLVPAGKGARQISAIGDRFVDALPDREDARAALSSIRKRRLRQKSPNVNNPKATK